MDNWHEGAHLAGAAARAGLNLLEMEAAIADDPASHDASLAANDASLRVSGHWGVPTMVFKGEPFFGQDRFDVLLWRLKQEKGNTSAKKRIDDRVSHGPFTQNDRTLEDSRGARGISAS